MAPRVQRVQLKPSLVPGPRCLLRMLRLALRGRQQQQKVPLHLQRRRLLQGLPRLTEGRNAMGLLGTMLEHGQTQLRKRRLRALGTPRSRP